MGMQIGDERIRESTVRAPEGQNFGRFCDEGEKFGPDAMEIVTNSVECSLARVKALQTWAGTMVWILS